MRVCVCVCVCVCVRACMCVRECVCVSHIVQWYVQSISNRGVAGSIPGDYGRTCFSSLSHSPSSSFILLGGYQQPVFAGVCGVACFCQKRKRKMKNRDSLARKSHFNQLCGGYQAKNSGGQFISLASCWCNSSTICYV